MPRRLRRTPRLLASTQSISADDSGAVARRPLPSLADAAAAWASLLRARADGDRAVPLTPAQALDLAVTLERLARPDLWALREEIAAQVRQAQADFDAERIDAREVAAILRRAHARLAAAVDA